MSEIIIEHIKTYADGNLSDARYSMGANYAIDR